MPLLFLISRHFLIIHPGSLPGHNTAWRIGPSYYIVPRYGMRVQAMGNQRTRSFDHKRMIVRNEEDASHLECHGVSAAQPLALLSLCQLPGAVARCARSMVS